ncbi:MAG TPA: sigma-54 dependent transcriptional regulator [Gammaproteobacteria bacterium]|jgi:two-component system repressor protein LuxO
MSAVESVIAPATQPLGARRVLLVEDSPSQALCYQGYLADEAYDVVLATDGESALQCTRQLEPELILLDLGLPDISGVDLLMRLRSDGIDSPVVVITDNESLAVAAEAVRLGADDYLAKPFGAERLRITVQNALERRHLRRLVRSYDGRVEVGPFHGMAGQSPRIRKVFDTIRHAGPTPASIFITGETGTGKELCARAIHAESQRRDMPFIALNCAAIPRELMESEIFGHEKGAFTGASQERAGAAARAHGGTLFLDEICDMDLDLQAKLLRFVQSGSFEKVGGSTQTVDVRFVAATNKDPLKEVSEGRFREDLYYRLHVVPIVLPPLRARHGDIMIIAERILEQACREYGKTFLGFDARAEQLLRERFWPGNVRELENVIRNAVVLHSGDRITARMLPSELGQRESDRESSASHVQQASPAVSPAAIETLAAVERRHIELAVATFDGSIGKAAAALGVNASTLYRKLDRWKSRS